MKAKSLVILILVFLSIYVPFISAYDSAKAGTWLVSESNAGNFNDNIIDSAIAGVALKSLGYDNELTKVITYLRSKEDSNYCWPKNSCKVKDTAFAIMALNEAGEDTQNELDWLIKAQGTFSSGLGTWWLQVATEESGSCKITYTVGEREGTKTFTIDEGKFSECGDKRWLDIGTCLVSGLLSKGKVTLNVDCSGLTGTPIISTIFQTGNDYYLFDDQFSNQAELTVRNTCYGTTSKATCDYRTSLYTNWILKKVGDPDLTLFYLYSGYVKTDVMSSSILALVDGSKTYFEDLKDKQRSDGSFNSRIEDSAFGAMALSYLQDESATKASNWLGTRQRSDGSFGSVYETALAVYALEFSGQTDFGCVDGLVRDCSIKGICKNTKVVEVCEDGTWSGCDYSNVDGYESEEYTCSDNLDNDCDGLIDEDDTDCQAKESEEDWGDDNEPVESVCGDGTCNGDEDSLSCIEDCPEETNESDNIPSSSDGEKEGGGFPWWILILILILAGGIYFYYVKFYKKPVQKKVEEAQKSGFLPRLEKKKENLFSKLFGKKKKKIEEKPHPEGKEHPAFKSTGERKDDLFYSRTSSLDKELEKSLSEAQKLIGGGKK
ncbi:MAG: hypothetical protein PHG05_00385 [Candidatus Nanoarchaeia archaeon]|nr:hypothetical protein [Candidatus Nanoarchaeia archaeon]